MSNGIRYVAEPSHVREVSLLGTADLAFWTTRLRQENLLPIKCGDRTQLLIVAAEMTFMGIRFTEVSFSARVIMPEDRTRDAVFLIHAFNSCRFFALCERFIFATPYSYAVCQLSASACPSIRIALRDETIFQAGMESTSVAPTREPSCREYGWEGAVFLPSNRRDRGGDGRLFFGKMTGHACAYPFLKTADAVVITPTRDTQVLQVLLDSGFTGEEWVVRADATHGKSKSYRRREAFGRQA